MCRAVIGTLLLFLLSLFGSTILVAPIDHFCRSVLLSRDEVQVAVEVSGLVTIFGMDQVHSRTMS